MPVSFRGMLDLITFYKPVRVFADEKIPLLNSFIGLTLVFVIYWAIYFIFSAVIFSFLPDYAAVNGICDGSDCFVPIYPEWMLLLYGFFVISVPLASFPAFIVSKFFPSRDSFVNLISHNYYIAASVSILLLIAFIPFAEFAGLLFVFLGIIIYFYILYSYFNSIVTGPSYKGAILLLSYVLTLPPVMFAYFYFLGMKIV